MEIDWNMYVKWVNEKQSKDACILKYFNNQ